MAGSAPALDVRQAGPFHWVTAAKMWAPAPPWPPLLPLLLLPMALLGQPPGAQGCSVDTTLIEVVENTNVTWPLVNISVPNDQQVTLGPSSTLSAFRIVENQLFLNVIPDFEKTPTLEAQVECKRDNIVVTQLKVLVVVLDVNDNEPVFPFTTKIQNVSEDTKVNSVVIPEEELEATDPDKDDILFYTLQEVTPGASSFFSLMGANRPALQLDQPLDFYKWQNMTFQLLARDTFEENVEPSHTATATVALKVLPADLRPPWFLPCTYSDGYVCIQAQYRGAVPTGHILPSPLILHPGPIYAVDGDRGLNERIIYSILGGNTDNTFAIDADSGNLTMVKSIPSPMTFFLLVRGEQADLARYSVTQVTVEALSVTGSPPRFPQSLYHGIVEASSEAGVAVKDATSPSQPLRIRAQDPEFPDLNSAIAYQITNCSEFRMDGESVLTTVVLESAEVFYAEVMATNTVTGGTATTVAEIRVSEQEPPTTGPPESPSAPEAGGTAEPSTSTSSEVPGPSDTSQGPSVTSSGWGTSLHPPSGATLRPLNSTTPVGLPSMGASTTPQPVTTSGISVQTPKPGTSQPTAPSVETSSSLRPATPGDTAQTLKPGTSKPTAPSGGNGSYPWPATTLKPDTSQPVAPGPSGSSPPSGGGSTGGTSTQGSGPEEEDGRFSVVDMAVLGGVLGALLLLALLGLAMLTHKHYGHKLHCCSGKASGPQPRGFDNAAFLQDQEAPWAPAPSPEPGPASAEAPAPPSPAPLDPQPPSPAPPESPAAARVGDSPSAVRSILTKERRPEGGYKAVWFGEDIGAEADVVVLNTPAAEGDSGSEVGSGSEDEGRGEGRADAAGADSTYI